MSLHLTGPLAHRGVRSPAARGSVVAAVLALVLGVGVGPASAEDAPTPTPTSTQTPSSGTQDATQVGGATTTTLATTTVTGWEGTRSVMLGTTSSRWVAVTPGLGREVRLQTWNGKGWVTISTQIAANVQRASVLVSVPASNTITKTRYRLYLPATATASRLVTGELVVSYTRGRTTIGGWDAATTDVVYGTAASRVVTLQSGRAVTLQQYSSGAWRDVRGYVVPISGELRVTLPTVWTTSRSMYRITVSATVSRLAATSPTWTIRPVAPPMPAQKYNGEVSTAVGTWAGYTNGSIPTAILCSPSWTYSYHKTRCDADAALEAMNTAFRAEFGTDLSITSSYRTYAQQVALKISKPTLAAKPGTSNHGWGLAIDFGGGIQTWGSAQHKWMRANANSFGWYHPAWAQFSGSKPEAWHWEYAGTVASGSAAQTRALATQLVRTQTWNGAVQRRCLTDLWNATSLWSYTKSTAYGDRRGLAQLSMKATFGSTWSSSSAAREYLRNPQSQIEWGLRDITKNHTNACGALADLRAADVTKPAVPITITGAGTVAVGKPAVVTVGYTKADVPVASAVLTLQHLRNNEWVDVRTVRIVEGTAVREITADMGGGIYRIRNANSSAVSRSFTITLAS